MKPNDTTGDTLDIRPLGPGGVSYGGENQPESAAAARAKIAALSIQTDVQGQQATPTLPVKPVSPAAENARRSRKVKSSKLRPIVSAIMSFLFLLAFFKSQVLLSQLQYLTNKPTTPTTQVAQPVSTQSTIIIPKINVNAPIVFEPSFDETRIQKALENGVVHYGNTPNPGQPGNSVIVGHSSNDWWEPGNYKFVFVLLDKLAVGDEFQVDYQGKQLNYKISEVKIVEPTDLTVLAQTSDPTMTLITCTPPGTSWKRLIIKAKQTNPTAEQLKGATPATTGSTQPLPSNAPSFTDQMLQVWNSFTGLFKHKNQPAAPTNSGLPSNL
ncbi:MAG TPA: class D sortase [Candidatus Nanoarchaeia archaeon]|nr:class D sortase [Candidatus Nanoarchaeia archaeon]